MCWFKKEPLMHVLHSWSVCRAAGSVIWWTFPHSLSLIYEPEVNHCFEPLCGLHSYGSCSLTGGDGPDKTVLRLEVGRKEPARDNLAHVDFVTRFPLLMSGSSPLTLNTVHHVLSLKYPHHNTHMHARHWLDLLEENSVKTYSTILTHTDDRL